MGKISSREIILPCGEPGQTPVGDVKEKEHYSFSAGNCHFFSCPINCHYFWLAFLWVLICFALDPPCHKPSSGFALNTRSVGS